MVLLILFLSVNWASFPGNEGLDLEVSNRVPYHPLGSNVTIYCTDQFSDDLDWLKGPQGKSHLSACSLTKTCLPSGQKYTVDPKNRQFSLNLYNLKYSDCGTYWCKNYDDRQSYKLELIEQVNNIDKQESDGTLSITTNCVLPTFTVDIQWYYIYKDGSPRIYEKPAARIEDRGRCQGACEGNNAMKVSSSLTPPIGENNVIPVKFMAYVQQGDNVQQLKFSKEYLIEGCAGAPIWHIVSLILVPALFCIVCHVVLTISYRRDNKPLKNIVPNLVAIWICLVMLVCFGILIAIGEDPTVPDVFGTCHNNYSLTVIVIEICCILTMFGLIAETIYHCCMKRYGAVQRQAHTQEDIEMKEHREMHAHSGEDERNTLLTQGLSTRVETAKKKHHAHSSKEDEPEKKRLHSLEERRKEGEMHAHSGEDEGNTLLTHAKQNYQAPSSEEDETEKKRLKSLEEKRKDEERVEAEKKRECDASLPCTPVVRNRNEQCVDLGGRAILQCSIDTEDYPSWQGPDGSVINYGGFKDFEQKDRFSWQTSDEKSLVINKVQESDAGRYVCFSSKGEVQTLDLAIRLPSEEVEVNSSETAELKIGEKMTRHYPLWRRLNNLNAELHKELFVENISWDDDNKGLIIRNVQKKDEGEYEVCANHLLKRFIVSMKASSSGEKERRIEEGTHIVRLECSSSKDVFPSWECVGSGIFNIAGEDTFRRHEDHKKADKRFGWSADKRSLLIKKIRLNDTGTYVCRHSDGSIESVIVVVKGHVESKKNTKMTDKHTEKVAYYIVHNSSTSYPALTLVTGDGRKQPLAYQNHKAKNWSKYDRNKGTVIVEAPLQLQETTVESSTFRGKILIHHLLNH